MVLSSAPARIAAAVPCRKKVPGREIGAVDQDECALYLRIVSVDPVRGVNPGTRRSAAVGDPVLARGHFE